MRPSTTRGTSSCDWQIVQSDEVVIGVGSGSGGVGVGLGDWVLVSAAAPAFIALERAVEYLLKRSIVT